MADELSQLLQASWRGIAFLTSDLTITFDHDQAIHAVYGKDVSNVEATGRGSRTFSAQIPFYNNVVPAANERDVGGSLFPNVFNKFYDAFADKNSGDLIHPRVGKVTVKPKTYKEHIDPQRRDGISVDVTWIESDDSPTGTAPRTDSPAHVTGVVVFAEDLDNVIGQMNPPPKPAAGDPPFTSFADMAANIRSLFDRTTLLVKRIGGSIDNMASELDRLKESIDRLNDVALWPVIDAIEHLNSSLNDLLNETQQSNKQLSIYTTRGPSTLGALAAMLHTDLTSMMQLNPLLLESPTVPIGSQVFYYVSR